MQLKKQKQNRFSLVSAFKIYNMMLIWLFCPATGNWERLWKKLGFRYRQRINEKNESFRNFQHHISIYPAEQKEFITCRLSTGTEKWFLKWITTYQIRLSLLHSNATESFQRKYYRPSISKQNPVRNSGGYSLPNGEVEASGYQSDKICSATACLIAVFSLHKTQNNRPQLCYKHLLLAYTIYFKSLA